MICNKQMPPDARVWVYQSNRALSDAELSAIKEAGIRFISDWTAHGADLKAGFDILYSHFIIISVDERQVAAGGCSIDKSIHFIKELEKQFNLSLLNRMQVAYRSEGKIKICNLSEFEKLIAQKKVDQSTVVFNNTISTKAAFDKEWEIPLEQSWLSRVLI